MIHTTFVRTQADSAKPIDLTRAVDKVLERLWNEREYPIAVQIVNIEPEYNRQNPLDRSGGQILLLCVTLQGSTEEEI